MADPFLGEIKMFGGNFAPSGYAKCDGQLLAISQYQALFALLGTNYGGDGRTTFGIPDFRGRSPMNWGQGPGLTNRTIGAAGGAESTTVAASHSHTVGIPADAGEGQKVEPNASYLGAGEEPTKPYSVTSNTTLASFNTGSSGSSSVNNMHPFLPVTFIIALVGLFPSRS